jgi:biopolymer transport protein ExbD
MMDDQIKTLFNDKPREMRKFATLLKLKTFAPIVVLKCDSRTRYIEVHRILTIATENGFRRWQLHVLKQEQDQ